MTKAMQAYLAEAEPAAKAERDGNYRDAAKRWKKAKETAQFLGMLTNAEWADARQLRCQKLTVAPIAA